MRSDRRALVVDLLAAVIGSLGTEDPPSEDAVACEDLPPEHGGSSSGHARGGGIRECGLALLDVERYMIAYGGDYYTCAVQSGPIGPSVGCDGDFLQVDRDEPDR